MVWCGVVWCGGVHVFFVVVVVVDHLGNLKK